MTEPHLDAGSSGGRYKLVGGRPSLDFVNTVSWPGGAREHDWMDSPGNWLRWNQLAGLLDDATAARLAAEFAGEARSRRLLALVHQARSDIAAALEPLAKGRSPSAEAVAALESRVREAADYRRIDHRSLRWRWRPPKTLEELVHPVLFDAGELLTAPTEVRRRIGFCPTCSWMFFDTSKNRGRRWCDMADCGSRAKSRAYYRRSRDRADSSGRGS